MTPPFRTPSKASYFFSGLHSATTSPFFGKLRICSPSGFAGPQPQQALCGAYCSWSETTLSKACILSAGPYNIENIYAEAYVVYTNKTMTGAMRGFGAPQVCFAYESHMDDIATLLNSAIHCCSFTITEARIYCHHQARDHFGPPFASSRSRASMPALNSIRRPKSQMTSDRRLR